MSSETTTKILEAAAVPPPGATTPQRRSPQGHQRLLTRRDRLTLGLMAGLPTILHVALVWVTALASIL
ncbi:sugar ABC transporter permease, partial [Streptomyces sp. NPDC013978]